MYIQRDTSNYKPANLTVAKPKSLWRSIKAGTSAVIIAAGLLFAFPLWPFILAGGIGLIAFNSLNK